MIGKIMLVCLKNGKMGNCLPCRLRDQVQEVDRRSARTSYFDAKRREKEAMTYTRSEFAKEKIYSHPRVKLIGS